MSNIDYDSYNSTDSLYKYELKFRVDTCVKIAFSKSEMQKVYATMNENDFWNIPSDFANRQFVSDKDDHILEFHQGVKSHTVEVYYGSLIKDNHALRQFENIFNIIDSILRTKPAYKGIPRHDMIRA